MFIKLFPLPKLTKNLDITYPINCQVQARIHQFLKDGKLTLLYEIKEPVLTAGERLLLAEIKDALIDLLDIDIAEERAEESLDRGSGRGREYLRKALMYVLTEYGRHINESTFSKLFYFCYNSLIGYGNLQPLFDDFFVKEIILADNIVFVRHRVYGVIRTTAGISEEILSKIKMRSSLHLAGIDITMKKKGFVVKTEDRCPPLPTELTRIAPIDIFAYLWHKIEAGASITFDVHRAPSKRDALLMLSSLSYFIPSTKKICLINFYRGGRNIIAYIKDETIQIPGRAIKGTEEIVKDVLAEKPDCLFADFYEEGFSKIKLKACVSQSEIGEGGAVCIFGKNKGGIVEIGENKKKVFEHTKTGYKFYSRHFSIDDIRAVAGKTRWLRSNKLLGREQFEKAINSYYENHK